MNRRIETGRKILAMLGLVLLAPYLFGTSPLEPQDETVIEGRIRTVEGSPINGAIIRVSVKKNTDSLFRAIDSVYASFELDITDQQPSHRLGLPPISYPDTSLADGSYHLRFGLTDYSPGHELDSFQLHYRLADGRTGSGLPFARRDTTSRSELRVYRTDVQTGGGSGCSCSTQPDGDTISVGRLDSYLGRDLIVD